MNGWDQFTGLSSRFCRSDFNSHRQSRITIIHKTSSSRVQHVDFLSNQTRNRQIEERGIRSGWSSSAVISSPMVLAALRSPNSWFIIDLDKNSIPLFLLNSPPNSVYFQVIPEEDDDMWHAYNLIVAGDTVQAVTVRFLLTANFLFSRLIFLVLFWYLYYQKNIFLPLSF